MKEIRNIWVIFIAVVLVFAHGLWAERGPDDRIRQGRGTRCGPSVRRPGRRSGDSRRRAEHGRLHGRGDGKAVQGDERRMAGDGAGADGSISRPSSLRMRLKIGKIPSGISSLKCTRRRRSRAEYAGSPSQACRTSSIRARARSRTGQTPFVLSILSPEYTEAYELIPEGSLMREYLVIRLGRFSKRGWESIKAQPDEPYPVQAPKLDAGDEFELRKMLTSAGDAGWLEERLRSLDADAARQYEATRDVTERLAVFRRLVEIDGKELGVEEIRAEYDMRSHGWDEEKIAAHIELMRVWAAEDEALSRMTPRQRYINHVESTLCGDLMSHVVGQDFRAANSGPGQCDIAKVITLTKEALEAGNTASSEEQLREAVEFARQTPGQ